MKPLIDLYGTNNSSTKIFSLVKIENEGMEEEKVGGIYFNLTDVKNYQNVLNKDEPYFIATPEFKFIIEEKFRNKDENFICSVNRGDIINIRSEYVENKFELLQDPLTALPLFFYKKPGGEGKKYNVEQYSLHTATLTFLFKENSFPDVFG